MTGRVSRRCRPVAVMAGLVPASTSWPSKRSEDVDARLEAGHDAEERRRGCPLPTPHSPLAIRHRVRRRERPALGQLHDLAVPDRHAAVHLRGEVHVVGRDQGCETRGADDRDQGLEHVACGVRVEVAGRLVGEQQPRRVRDRARDRDALLFAAGQFARAMARAARSSPRSRGAERRALRASAFGRPRMIWGITTFSRAENSGRRWWNW